MAANALQALIAEFEDTQTVVKNQREEIKDLKEEISALKEQISALEIKVSEDRRN